jgi:anti-anti-sigma factor
VADELLTSSVEMVDGATIISVCGEVDMSNVAEFANVLFGTVEAATGPVVVDARALHYIDSSGMRVLVNAATRANECHISFGVRAPHPQTRRVIEILGLGDDLLDN